MNRLPAMPSPRPLAAATIVYAAAERWRLAAAARGRSLTASCELDGAQVLGDARQLERALDNLIANALEHGTLNVSVRSARGPRGIRIAVGDGCSWV